MEPTPIDVTSSGGWQTIVAHLPEEFEALAKEHKVLEVQYGEAKITTATDLLRLVLVHAGTGLGLRQTVALVAEDGGPDVSHVTLHKKMRLASPYLAALVRRVTQSGGVDAAPERWAGYELALVDASTFCGPGAESTDARVHLQLRLTDLAILEARMEDRSVGESFKRFTWHAGQLALGDRGYANPPGIASVVEQGADVLVRVNRQALPMFAPHGDRVDVMAWLRSLKAHSPRERTVVVRSHEHDFDVQGRLIAVRLPAAEAEKARVRVRREFGGKTSALDLEAAQYVVLFTTVPTSRMPIGMCLELYRLRWQVELAFKRWKSLCHFDQLPNYRDDTILAWLNAKLLLALLMHRMASGASALFPPAQQNEEPDMALDAMEGRQHSLATNRQGVAAA
jgi:hypothetical protein